MRLWRCRYTTGDRNHGSRSEADRRRIEETAETELLDAALDEVVTAESKEQVLENVAG